ncbi:hypothetical protein [Faecalicatena contorta]|uniref:hypothetical protein n=1 Tax=Faecalicatena contorta TaxID=39482 RepID=UPI001F327941|nr:hypothetical protein [Faecalicatena contorta]MCF2555572.1 hypothetical protein [Faecalicatena contorta]
MEEQEIMVNVPLKLFVLGQKAIAQTEIIANITQNANYSVSREHLSNVLGITLKEVEE